MHPLRCRRLALTAAAAIVFSLGARAQQPQAPSTDQSPRTFTIDTEVNRTPVRNQYRTGTCWDHATLSFLESELLRTGKGEYDLSEMWIVRHTYPKKALAYVRNEGAAQFGEGGQAHDVLDRIREYGIVPENVYDGMRIDESRHNHGEMFTVLKAMLDAVDKKSGGRITPRWQDAFEAVLDAYLGRPPASFEYRGKTYTPKSFAQSLGLNLDDYVELTSYTHHPFYGKMRLEVPDNWSQDANYYNVPIDDLEAIIDNALKTGYSVAWDGDVSEREFSPRAGYAFVPARDYEEQTQAERAAKPTAPEPEKDVTQALRQKTFDNHTTTDDHLMHIVGLAHDQAGNKFYYTKNSGGTDQRYGGYLYMSRAYVRLKTVAILVNKASIPPPIAQKLALRAGTN